MDVDSTETKPTWWLLYTLGAALVGSIAVIETSVPSGAARLALELAAVVAVSVSTLAWLRSNRGRIELAEAPRSPATVLTLAATARATSAHKHRVKIAAAGRRLR